MINKIKKYDLCIGCGLCEAVMGREVCKMELNNKGFYEPIVNEVLDKKDSKLLKSVCPGIHVETTPNKGAWGSMKSICEAWATDKTIRHKAASGGVVTSLAISLLEHHEVDAILQIGVKDGSYLYNELKVSRTKDDILSNAQSRYAPALVFPNIKKVLESSSETFAFIGKPCDIAGIKNYLSIFPAYKDRIRYFISIFCAGMPSYNATELTWKQSGHKDEPVFLKYRGEGWPGNFCAKFENGDKYEISYNDSWGKILGRSLGFRCKICPDGIGMLADVAVGDSWNTKDGYPDFTESEGRCFCMIRTDNGTSLFNEAVKVGYIEKQDLDINRIQEMQAYQFERRKLSGWRILPVQLTSGFILKFKGLSITKQALTANLKKGLSNTKGTFKRIIKNR